MMWYEDHEHTPFIDFRTINERLFALSMRTGYTSYQRNGQRFYGPPPHWQGPPPGKGCEIFLGRLPRDCFEDELVPILESVAVIYELRLMMNFTGFNRGYAFVTFCNKEDAWKATIALNNFEIRPGHSLVASKSTDNCRLYIGKIPLDKNKKEIWDEMKKICPTLRDILMYPCARDPSKNRGFLFVEFDSHRCAAMVKRELVPGTVKLWGQSVRVDWAHPEPDIDPHVLNSVTVLFVRSVSSSFNKEFLQRILVDIVPPHTLERMYIRGHYGFIHFSTRDQAQYAKDKLSAISLDGENLEVQWARPQIYSKLRSNNNMQDSTSRPAHQVAPQEGQQLVGNPESNAPHVGRAPQIPHVGPASQIPQQPSPHHYEQDHYFYQEYELIQYPFHGYQTTTYVLPRPNQ